MGILFYMTSYGSRPQGEGLGNLALPAIAQGRLGWAGPLSPVCLRRVNPAMVKGLGDRAGQPKLGCHLYAYYLWHPERIIKPLCASVFLAVKWGQ